MKGAIWMEGNSPGEDTQCFLLRKSKGVISELQFTSKRRMVYFTCLDMDQAVSTKDTPREKM
jgi:hypothetical protein